MAARGVSRCAQAAPVKQPRSGGGSPRQRRATARCASQSPAAGGTGAYQRRLDALASWAREHGGGLAEFIALRDLSASSAPGAGGFGGGAVATRPVARGERLLTVPETLLMTAESAARGQSVGDSAVAAAVRRGELSEWQAVCAHAAEERRLGERSFWAPYLATLPPQDVHPLSWSAPALDGLLGARSPMRQAIAERQETVAADAEAIAAAGCGVSAEEVRWAAATLLSRSFELGADGGFGGSDPREMLSGAPGARLALAPIADALNHSSAAEAEVEWAPAPHERFAELVAGRKWAKGEQVFFCYAEGMAPCDLFGEYAFVEPEGAQALDAVDLDISELQPHGRGCPRAGALLGAARDVLLCGAARVDVSGSRGVDVMRLLGAGAYGAASDALAAARLAAAVEEDLHAAGAPGDAAAEGAGLAALRAFASPVSRGNELRALGALVGALESLAADAPDESAAAAAGVPPHVVAAALSARRSERRAAAGAAALFNEWRERLEGGAGLAELYGLDEDSSSDDDWP